jgi:hypothetical protein
MATMNSFIADTSADSDDSETEDKVKPNLGRIPKKGTERWCVMRNFRARCRF